MTNLVIFGASRGLGAAFAAGIPVAGDRLWLVSRSRPQGLERADGITRAWIQADLATTEAAAQVKEVIGEATVDLLLYNAGIWEEKAFSPSYQFAAGDPTEHARVLQVNLQATIDCVQRLISNLRRSDNGKIILIGSTSGLENTRTPEVAYNASKFGLRGAAHALREGLRPDYIGVTVINPGTITTEVPYEAGIAAAGRAAPDGIPVGDLVELVRCVMRTSRFTCIKEIDVPAMLDPHA